MECRQGCAACCIYLSISSPIPGMPDGKPSGTKCIHLDQDLRCSIYETRPKVCRDFTAELLFCGKNADEAKSIMIELAK
ncbi:MAG: hypothetical protein A2W91_19360 [Bacteroidetes bacterium GWF2_38_335]|nr:MAG: hypothetical protein A2W91_19360 [Bacteroidetes bacterium GWF2_38_335]OFY79917.1 MAG: hypothetical protein A2281_10760 [Bacteroidetes bacterium RIFOXYA12_FULL_38_20]HBS86374.1 hypothetical protein [Bacteroidales bacterium]